MNDSILDSTKKLLGLAPDDNSFDIDIVTHINTVFLILNQLGIGPKEGFAITGRSETWDTYLGNQSKLQCVKSYMALKVRNLFDPPSSTAVSQASAEALKELEFRMLVEYDY